MWLVVPAFIAYSAFREGAPVEDVLLSIAGFLVASSLLFAWSRGRTNAEWMGVVEDKQRIVRGREGRRRVTLRVIARTARGRRVTAEVTPAGFELLRIGDMVAKRAGFEFADKVRGSADAQRICMACGTVYPVADAACPGCGLENI